MEGDFINTGLLVLQRILQAIFLTIAIYRGVKLYANGETNRLWSHVLLSVVLGIFVFAPGIAKYLALYVLRTLGISVDGLTNTMGGMSGVDERDKVESYRALYRVRPLIYHIGDIRLWMPIRQDGVVMWFVYVVVFFVLVYVIPVLAWIWPLDRVILMAVGPIAAAYYTVKLDPAGKTVPRYIRDLVHFLLRRKWIVRWQLVRRPGGRRPVSFTGYCRPYTCVMQEGGLAQWRGASGWLKGTAKGMRMLAVPANMRVRWRGRNSALSIKPMKRAGKQRLTPPAMLEEPEHKALTWTTGAPLQGEREIRKTGSVIWRVNTRDESPASPIMPRREGKLG